MGIRGPCFCYTDNIGTCSRAIRQITSKNIHAFSQLKKVHLVLGSLPFASNLTNRLFLPPVNLTHIKISCLNESSSIFLDLMLIVNNYACSLISFKLHFPELTAQTEETALHLPVCPALTTLELVTTNSFGDPNRGSDWPLSMVDIFGLRKIFLVSNNYTAQCVQLLKALNNKKSHVMPGR